MCVCTAIRSSFGSMFQHPGTQTLERCSGLPLVISQSLASVCSRVGLQPEFGVQPGTCLSKFSFQQGN